MKNKGPGKGSGGNGFSKLRQIMAEDWQLYLLVSLPVVYFLVFHYLPMYGVVMAFQNFSPVKGFWKSPFAGFSNFTAFFKEPYFGNVFKNTLLIKVYSEAVEKPLAIIFALMLNTLRWNTYKRAVQTLTYMPHFITAVVLVGMLKIFLSPSTGIVNLTLGLFGIRPVNFMGKSDMFYSLFVWSGVWQNLGWMSIIYLAALTGVNPELHEAAIIDGSGRLGRIWHVDIPAIIPTVIITVILGFGQLMSVGFEKAFLMQNDMNIQASEVISTYSYRMGLLQGRFSYGAAIGLFNSVINLILLTAVNKIAKRISDVSLW
jgi:putative aldouronate transport system permease protein